MAYKIKTVQQLSEFIKTARESASQSRTWLSASTGASELFYQGLQYAQVATDLQFRNTTMGRVFNRWNPDMGSLRVTSNHVTEKTLVAAAATYPVALNPTVEPPRRDMGPTASMVSQTLEDLLAGGVDAAGLVAAAQTANLRRSICGSYGIGLTIRNGFRNVRVNGVDVQIPTRDIVASPIHPTRFILDDAIEERDLRKHEYVVLSDVWTVGALRASYPAAMKGVDEQNLKTVGDLSPYEQGMNAASEGTLFTRWKQYSKTKGARIYQVHCKDETGRFGEMYVGIEIDQKATDGGMIWANQDDFSSPFGGDGLPLILLHGHRRASGPWGIGEVAMMRDSQQIVNLTWTMIFRHLQQFVSPRMVGEKRWFGTLATDEEIYDKINNKPGSFILGKPSDKAASPPQLLPAPPFNGELMTLATSAEQKMRRDSMRSEQNAGGGTKSHVAFATTQALLAEGDRVMGIRRTEDCRTYEQILGVLLGTEVKHVQEQSASTLARLDKDGFDQQDITTILRTDAQYPTCGIALSESDLEYRSDQEKRETLATSLQNQAINPEQFARGMAELDQAISPDDKAMRTQIQKAVSMFLVTGQPWAPMPMGQYNSWVLMELRKARFDRRVKFDPMQVQRVDQAIILQNQMAVQEAIQSNPELVMQQQLAQQQQAHEAQQAQMEAEQAKAEEASEEQEDQPQTLADLLSRAA